MTDNIMTCSRTGVPRKFCSCIDCSKPASAHNGASVKPCPFCGAGETISEPDSKVWVGMEWRILSWRIRHWCSDNTHGSLLTVRGKDQQEAEGRWNRRTP